GGGERDVNGPRHLALGCGHRRCGGEHAQYQGHGQRDRGKGGRLEQRPSGHVVSSSASPNGSSGAKPRERTSGPESGADYAPMAPLVNLPWRGTLAATISSGRQ